MNRPEWLEKLTEEVRDASKAFPENGWPDAWLFLGESESNSEEWYDWDEPLLGLPVYHHGTWLSHSGYDGEHQKIVPLWKGDTSNKQMIMREFYCRIAKSGDFLIL